MGSVDGSHQPWLAWMRRALQLASLAEGRTSPNPLVGAVVLDADGRLVGEGFHARAGEPHAEPVALAQAGDAARGGTIIVTLEPCCHHGRTPPCTEAILAAGVRRVVVALTDPDPRVAGGGLQRLRDAGLEVISGVLAAEAAHQNRAFIHRVQTGRPWGILKWAMSLDGRTALPNGESQWISGPPARAAWLARPVRCGDRRRWHRAFTTCCSPAGAAIPEPLRAVLSSSLNLPSGAQIWDQQVASSLLAYPLQAESALTAELRAVVQTQGVAMQALNASEPELLLTALAQRGCNRVLWECGPALAAAAIQQGCVQEIAAVIAPTLLGGELARTPLGDLGFTAMDQVQLLRGDNVQRLGDDLLLQARLT